MGTDIEKCLQGDGEVFLKDIGIRKGQLINFTKRG
jgi:hypothetical protein